MKMMDGITDLMWPLLIWAVGWVVDATHTKIREWLERKEYEKALKIYDLIAKAVNEVYCGGNGATGVRELKSSESFTDIVKTVAMDSAINKIKSMATNISLPEDGELKLMVEQVISDRKGGVFSPLVKKIGLGS